MSVLDRITILDLDTFEQNELDALLTQLKAKQPRNEIRAAFYDGKNAVSDLGISTPPNMARVATVLGWSAKAVDILNRRCNLDGFRLPEGLPDDMGLGQIWEDNMLDMEAPQAGVSSLIHATSFLIRTRGDVEAGEPKVLVTAKDAMSGTGTWDRRARRLSSFLSILGTDSDKNPTEMALYLPNLTITMTKRLGAWSVERQAHKYGVPVEPLVYQPRLGRPFGSSRISRPVMSLHGLAVRTVVRSEVSAEIYNVPQRVLLGADESSFTSADGSVKSAWEAVLGKVWAIGKDEEGDVPKIESFPAASQQPHMDQLRSLAQLFAGETSIPLASLGISGDANPTSEGAYDAGRDDLIHEAEGVTDGWTPAWRRTMLGAMQMYNGWSTIPDEAKKVQPNWRPPSTPSRASAADAGQKQLAAVPWLAETKVGLELLGLDADQITRALDEKRRADAQANLSFLMDTARRARETAAAAEVVPGDDAS